MCAPGEFRKAIEITKDLPGTVYPLTLRIAMELLGYAHGRVENQQIVWQWAEEQPSGGYAGLRHARNSSGAFEYAGPATS
jgi:hypothetical protein